MHGLFKRERAESTLFFIKKQRYILSFSLIMSPLLDLRARKKKTYVKKSFFLLIIPYSLRSSNVSRRIKE